MGGLTGETAVRVLVVDDDPLVLENTAAMLEDLGHRVIAARSGEEALGLVARAGHLDLVLTDQAMPGMTGLQLVERIRTLRPEIGTILASGYAEIPSGASPAVTRLAKPFDQAGLARTIRAVAAGTAKEPIAAARSRPH